VTDFRAIRQAVCAVGYLTVPVQEAAAKPKLAAVEVIGTGFLIASGHVITCAHVLEDLDRQRRRRRLGPDRAVLQFGYAADGLWQTRTHRFAVQKVQDDFAQLRVLGRPLGIQPVKFVGSNFAPVVGEEIALSGYAHGSALLKRGKELIRFGPVLQRGIVAALAPYDEAGKPPTSVLLDLVTGRAASGSPVFSVATGEVFGVLTEGQIGKTAALAIARTISLDENGNVVIRLLRDILPAPPGGGGKPIGA
jgi:hypothetical protein